VNKFSHTTGISNKFFKIFIWGHPLSFSLSPFFQEHAGIFEEKNVLYSIFRGSCENFREILLDKQCLGANVTVPNKVKALNLCDDLTETAKICGSVNTIFKKNERIIGDNTDGEGLFLWLTRNNFHENNIDILGNGGTARSVAHAFSKNGYSVRIFGREEKGWEKKFGSFYDIDCWQDTATTVNTLPFLKKGKNVIDISYQFGKISDDAAGMLACQGWLAFQRWFDSEISLKKFIEITFTHAQAQSNSFFIKQLRGL